ncbi:S41 family peptidase [Calidithermus roseus]|uniref:Carboxy-terminal processing protease CtpB n=1 Tax=Calidithermus roseus TaxID=1644118 RepID=A0A399EH78_9DEIN|nr:S41 family peptidase [Calidithermus roseus]RIH83288.1 Carboxy-terminal processing protease CtpB [Calidithermus roseus]
MKRLLVLVALLATAFGLGQNHDPAGQAQPPAQDPPCGSIDNSGVSAESTTGFPQTLQQAEDRAGVLDLLLAKIWFYYLDQGFEGKDWEKVSAQYKAQALQARSERAYYDALRGLVGELDGVFLSATQLEAQSRLSQARSGQGGIGTLISSSGSREGLTVRWVLPGSPAARAGIKARDRILAVNGRNCPSTDRIRGPEGTTITLSIKSPGQPPRDVVVQRAQVNYPPTIIEAKRLEADPAVGYLWVSELGGEQIPAAVEKALTELTAGTPLKGLILDLRGTGGSGMRTMRYLLGHFISGVKYGFEGPEFYERRNIPARKPDLSQLPLVVLVDRGTTGSANMSAAVLQMRPNTTLIGEKTGGGNRYYQGHELPDGSVFFIAQGRFVLPGEKPMEEEQLTPGVLLQQDWLEFTEADDPYIKAALERLK